MHLITQDFKVHHVDRTAVPPVLREKDLDVLAVCRSEDQPNADGLALGFIDGDREREANLELTTPQFKEKFASSLGGG